MGRYVTISVKVPKETKEELERMGIKPSALLKAAIEEAIRKKYLEEVKKDIERLRDLLLLVPAEDIVKSIREDRESR